MLIAFFFLAMVFEVVHLPRDWPFWLGWFRPHLSIMVIFFFSSEYPGQLSFFLVWFLGILLDVLFSSLLGVNGILLLVASYLGWRFCDRFVSYSYLQQSIVLFIVCFCFRTINLGISQDNWSNTVLDSIFGAVISAFLWPYLAALLRRLYKLF